MPLHPPPHLAGPHLGGGRRGDAGVHQRRRDLGAAEAGKVERRGRGGVACEIEGGGGHGGYIARNWRRAANQGDLERYAPGKSARDR